MTERAPRRLVVLAVSACIAAAALSAASSAQPPPSASPAPLSPAIVEIEVDWAGKGRLRLRAEVVPRGAEVIRVGFRYGGKSYRASETGKFKYERTVEARDGHDRGDTVRFRVKGCTATRCAARTAGDKAD